MTEEPLLKVIENWASHPKESQGQQCTLEEFAQDGTLLMRLVISAKLGGIVVEEQLVAKGADRVYPTVAILTDPSGHEFHWSSNGPLTLM